MQVKVTYPNKPTEAALSIIPNDQELAAVKKRVLLHFQGQVKIPGFRAGKAPLEMVEKHVEPAALQTRFLDEAIEHMYRKAMESESLRPVDRPKISLKKFVPFTALEFDASVAIIGEVKLADYKKPSAKKPAVAVSAKDVSDVIESLRTRSSEKKDIDRAAKDGDQVWIDFSGVDAKDQPVKGADGKDYPLLLGSNTFIPGFETNVVGLKAGEEKTFTLSFPKDYGVKALAGSKVTFAVVVTKVQEVVKPEANDDFAKTVGPFTTLAQLKEDIKKQLTIERQNEADKQYESDLIRTITQKSTLNVPDVLVDEQVERMLSQERQNAVYRGQTWEEYLKSQETDENDLKKQMRPAAEERVKASLVLSEIAEKEQVTLMPEELDARIAQLKTQYQDAQMQQQLNSDEARQEIASRMLTEKTIQILVGYATKKAA